MTLGECINNYVHENNLSFRKFADLAGCSHSYIVYLVNGKKSNGKPIVPTLDKYKSIAKAMGMDVNELIATVNDNIAWGKNQNGNRNCNISLEDHEMELIKLFRKADDRDQSLIWAILEHYQEDTISTAG